MITNKFAVTKKIKMINYIFLQASSGENTVGAIVILVIGAIIAFIAYAAQKSVKETGKIATKIYLANELKVGKTWNNSKMSIGIDYDKMKIIIVDNQIECLYKFSQLVRVHLAIDKEVLTTKSPGAAILLCITGLILGFLFYAGIGFIVGGILGLLFGSLFSTSKHEDKINKIVLETHFINSKVPIHYINFYERSAFWSEDVNIPAELKEAKEWESVLNGVLHYKPEVEEPIPDNNEFIGKENSTIVNEIERLAKLKKEGAISKKEYDFLKNEILKNNAE